MRGMLEGKGTSRRALRWTIGIIAESHDDELRLAAQRLLSETHPELKGGVPFDEIRLLLQEHRKKLAKVIVSIAIKSDDDELRFAASKYILERLDAKLAKDGEAP